MARKKHPKAIIERAIQYAEKHGWQVKASGKSAHACGILQCPEQRPGLSMWAFLPQQRLVDTSK